MQSDRSNIHNISSLEVKVTPSHRKIRTQINTEFLGTFLECKKEESKGMLPATKQFDQVQRKISNDSDQMMPANDL